MQWWPAALEELLPEPKTRSEAWLTSTFPDDSDDADAPLCSAGYHVRTSAHAPCAASKPCVRVQSEPFPVYQGASSPRVTCMRVAVAGPPAGARLRKAGALPPGLRAHPQGCNLPGGRPARNPAITPAPKQARPLLQHCTQLSWSWWRVLAVQMHASWGSRF